MRVQQFGSHPLQSLATFNTDANRWVILVHGGAWRDHRNTILDGEAWLSKLSNVSAASVGYRLSPEVMHPEHLDDVIAGIRYLCGQYEVKEIVLVGHSAGAFMSILVANSSALDLVNRISLVVSVEGIHNLNALEDEDPSYASFVIEAFGPDRAEWDKINPQTCARPLVIVHSPDDELLNDKIQPNLGLKLRNDTRRVVVRGKHEEVIKSEDFYNTIQELIATAS